MTIGRFLAGVGALLWHQDSDRYLLLKRSAEKDFAAGMWECVTGRVDQGEGFEDAVHREAYEELGVEIELMFIVGTTHFYRGREAAENELVGLVYCASIADPSAIRLSPEHDEYRWLTAAEARKLLSGHKASEKWLLNVLERAELSKRMMPTELLDANRVTGFELDS